MAQAIDMRRAEESGMTDGGAMVHDLDKGVVFISDCGIVGVDKAVGAA